MRRLRTISAALILLLLFAACSSSQKQQPKSFDLTAEERVWAEAFLRYFMFGETAIYTLAGSKPMTDIQLFYYENPEQRSEEGMIDFSCRGRVFSITELWDQWEQIADRLPLKKRFLFVKREWPPDSWQKNGRCAKRHAMYFLSISSTQPW